MSCFCTTTGKGFIQCIITERSDCRSRSRYSWIKADAVLKPDDKIRNSSTLKQYPARGNSYPQKRG